MMYSFFRNWSDRYLSAFERKQNEQRLKHEQSCSKNRKKRKSRK